MYTLSSQMKYNRVVRTHDSRHAEFQGSDYLNTCNKYTHDFFACKEKAHQRLNSIGIIRGFYD